MSSASNPVTVIDLNAGGVDHESEADEWQRNSLLERIFKQHCLLDLRFEHGAEAYQTAIIELVPERAYFVLDALTPASGNARTQGTPRIKLSAQLGALRVKFETTIVQRGGTDDAPFYKSPFPEIIDFPQRRREFRATVPLAEAVSVNIEAADGFEISGEVRDLSPSGFSARLNAGTLDRVAHANGLRARCEIKLRDGTRLAASVEICHVFAVTGREQLRIGARFIELDAPTERALERYVARLERERARLS